jgi:hypothetical protein
VHRTAAARALQAHVERLAQSELVRLRKKVAAAGTAHSAEVERLARHVVVAMAAHLATALRRSEEPEMVDAVVRLFGVSV